MHIRKYSKFSEITNDQNLIQFIHGAWFDFEKFVSNTENPIE